MTDKNYDDHPCFECARRGEGGATYDFPHPAVKCIVDNHRSLDILGDLRICLDGLYRKCPKNKEDQRLTDDQLFGEVDLEQEVTDLKNEIKFLRRFLVEKNLAEEYILWKLEVDD